MDADELDRFVLETLEAEPDPPRTVDRGALLVHCTLNVPSAVMIAAGVVTLLVVAELGAPPTTPGQDAAGSGFQLVMGGLGLGLALLPFLAFARFSSILRNGVLTTARITEVEPADAPHAPPSVPGVRVVGRRVVDHPTGPFEEAFSSDTPDAEALLPGSEVGVLVHPHRRRVLRELCRLR